jgi:hypothetical protein
MKYQVYENIVLKAAEIFRILQGDIVVFEEEIEQENIS